MRQSALRAHLHLCLGPEKHRHGVYCGAQRALQCSCDSNMPKQGTGPNGQQLPSPTRYVCFVLPLLLTFIFFKLRCFFIFIRPLLRLLLLLLVLLLVLVCIILVIILLIIVLLFLLLLLFLFLFLLLLLFEKLQIRAQNEKMPKMLHEDTFLPGVLYVECQTFIAHSLGKSTTDPTTFGHSWRL